VAKGCAQVGRSADNKISGTDADVFEKWSQALASIQDLVDDSAYQAYVQKIDAVRTIILPILVVPDGTLWAVMFDDSGAQAGKPRPTDRCSYFVDRSYTIGDTAYFAVSHLEFVTMTGLENLMEQLIGDLAADASDRHWFSDRYSFE
jgi:hypothetical protein